jgi:hypothetical protein
MKEAPFRFVVGPYWITFPGEATVLADVTGPVPGGYQVAVTKWIITLGRFRFFIHLNANEGIDGLKAFIENTTRCDVVTLSTAVNGIAGATHGAYGPPRTWIDWWFKKGDIMICLCLQSVAFPVTQPTTAELAVHREIINSLKYGPDFPTELPPMALR